jgi:hypothetical protein
MVQESSGTTLHQYIAKNYLRELETWFIQAFLSLEAVVNIIAACQFFI